ncbi:MAG TPA: ABC transporter permease [Spirochaetota bacterium]|nr:ABC transporter permease [Spirochaetota bacterium]HRS63316.1 ABC transporter permease [Spirochaetota bacterium]
MKTPDFIQRILAIADKEWLQIKRDKRSLILSLIAPAGLVFLFGYALTMDVKHVRTIIFDQSKSFCSRQFIENFSHNEYIEIVDYAESYKDVDRAIDSGLCAMAIVLPIDFEEKIKSGNSATVQLLTDGSDSTSAIVSTGYVKTITMLYNAKLQLIELKKQGFSEMRQPIDIRNRIWYNPELESKNFIIPGLIVIILAIISALIASLTISREWERGTFETLITTPVMPWELVFGKMFPYLFIGLFDVVATLSVGYFLFNVPLKGSFVEFYLMAILFLIGTSGLGIFISAATRVQVLSVQFAMVATYLPSFILSGFVFPINNMPSVVKAITYIVPARYLMVIIKGIVLKGIGFSVLWMQILFLFIYALIIITLAVKKINLTLPEN